MTEFEIQQLKMAHETLRLWLENHKKLTLIQSEILEDIGLYRESHTLIEHASDVDALLKITKL